MAVTSIAMIIIINRKWEAIKFLMFIKYNILTNDDGPENLNEMEFDAFITYRQAISYLWYSKSLVILTAGGFVRTFIIQFLNYL